jgi:hypothetical protein
MINEHEAVDGMITGRGSRSTGRKPTHKLHFSPKIPHELTWDGMRAAAVESHASD